MELCPITSPEPLSSHSQLSEAHEVPVRLAAEPLVPPRSGEPETGRDNVTSCWLWHLGLSSPVLRSDHQPSSAKGAHY